MTYTKLMQSLPYNLFDDKNSLYNKHLIKQFIQTPS
jgi:hypothetical protein